MSLVCIANCVLCIRFYVIVFLANKNDDDDDFGEQNVQLICEKIHSPTWFQNCGGERPPLVGLPTVSSPTQCTAVRRLNLLCNGPSVFWQRQDHSKIMSVSFTGTNVTLSLHSIAYLAFKSHYFTVIKVQSNIKNIFAK